MVLLEEIDVVILEDLHSEAALGGELPIFMLNIGLGVDSIDGNMQTLDVHKIGAVPYLLVESNYILILAQFLHLLEILYLCHNKMQIQSYFSIFLVTLFYSLA